MMIMQRKKGVSWGETGSECGVKEGLNGGLALAPLRL